MNGNRVHARPSSPTSKATRPSSYDSMTRRCGAFGSSSIGRRSAMADEDVAALTRLNGLYLQAAMRADAALFETILADDFLCSQSDGTLVDRPEFLRRTKASSPMPSLDFDDVRI